MIASATVLAGLIALSPAAAARTTTKAATVTHLNCNSPRPHAGRVLHCGVSVSTVRGAATPPTGAVRLATNVGAGRGTLSNGGSCVLATANRRTSRCSFTYVPKRAQTTTIYAGYPGDAAHAPSHASRAVTVIR